MSARPRRTIRFAAAVVAALAASSLPAARGAPHAAAALPPPQPLYMITDSVGLGAADAIRAAFAGWRVTIDADPGEFTETLEHKYVAARAATDPSVFGDHAIVAAGYNFPFWDPARFDRSVDSMIATLEAAGVKYIHWVTLREVREQDVSPAAWRQAAGYRWYLATVNQHLEAALERHPDLTLVDWAAVADQPGITYDAIHLNPAGAALYSSIVRHSVDAATTRVGDRSVTRVQVPDSEDVAAVSVNVTVTDPRHVGYLTAYACGAKPPTASFHNYVRGEIAAHSTIVPLDATGGFCIASRVATNLVVDVTGRFPTGFGYHPVGPTRWADTRESRPVASGGRLVLDLTDMTGRLGGWAPADVAAVALEVTATEAAGPGYLTVSGGCTTGARPTTSNVNYLTGETVPNLVIVEPGPTGRICIDALTRTDVVVDLVGVFDASAGVDAAAPRRVFDSRVDARGSGGAQPLAARTDLVLTADDLGVPADAGGLVLNLTAVGADPGFASARPCGGPGRATSQLNMPDPGAVSNATLVAPAADGSVCVYTSSATDLIVDVMGSLGEAYRGSAPTRVLDTRAR